MVAAGTLEERIATVLEDKRALADAVVGTGEAWLTELDDDELRELVALSEADVADAEGADDEDDEDERRGGGGMSRRFGQTWWSRRWIGALEDLGAAWATRLPRGRTYARQGRVTLQTRRGGAGGRGRAGQPRAALRASSCGWPTFDDATWDEVVAALAGRLRHAAALLDGAMPEDVDDVLADCGVSLFPGPRELRDPLHLPRRGQPVQARRRRALRAGRRVRRRPVPAAGAAGPRPRRAAGAAARGAGGGGRSVAVGRAGGASDGGAGAAATADEGVDWRAITVDELVGARGELDDIRARPHRPDDPGAVLRRLGAPPGPAADLAPALQAAVEAAAGRAWDLLVGADPQAADQEVGA